MMDRILMTVNLLLALVQAFSLGISWEKHRRASAASLPQQEG